MNYRKFFDKIQAKYIINAFFLIGFIIAGIRLEKYLYETEDYCNYPIQANIELVLSEQSNEEYILPGYDNILKDISYNVEDKRNLLSFKFTILSYNCFINSRFKSIVSNHIFHFDIISIIQMNNIWHKSSGEEPSILG